MADVQVEREMRAEFLLPSDDLKDDLPFFQERLGFQLDEIFPADDPAVAVISGHGVRIRLDRDSDEPPGKIRLRCDDPTAFAAGQTDLVAPNGTKIEIVQANPPMVVPDTEHSFVVRRLVEPHALARLRHARKRPRCLHATLGARSV